MEEVAEADPKPKLSQELLKFYRNRELCEVPRQLIYKLESEVRGCYRLKSLLPYAGSSATTSSQPALPAPTPSSRPTVCSGGSSP